MKFLYFVICICFYCDFNAQDLKSKKQKSIISFTENKGQVSDQNNNVRPDVLFTGISSGIFFYLKNSGISYQLCKIDTWKNKELSKVNENEKIPDKYTIYRLDVNWINANKNAEIVTDNTLTKYKNYYLEVCPNGIYNVRSFTGVTYKNIYKNIDLHYYEKNGVLKYDYLVAANTDYKKIKIEINGAQKIELQEDGSVVFTTELGQLKEDAPEVYQNNKTLKSKWIVSGNVLSFDITNYDSSLPLIIDPAVRVWGTYLGGTGDDRGNATTTDKTGNVYIAGHASSLSNIATVGSHQSTYGGSLFESFITKFNTSGSVIWSTYYGGNGSEEINSCAVDTSNNLYCAGWTSSSNGNSIATPGAHQTTITTDASFLVKLNSAGIRQWATYYGNSGEGVGICTIDLSGNVYLAGRTAVTTGTLIATVGSHQSTFGGYYDGYLVKFNSSGIRQWGTYYGGPGYEIVLGCTCDKFGNIYFASEAIATTGTVISSPGSHQALCGGAYDATLVKFDSNGNRLWATYYGGSGHECGYACKTDLNGNVFLIGATATLDNTNIISTPGSHQPAYGGGNDGFVAKFDSAGVRQWGTYYGGTNYECPWGADIDTSGNLYICGRTSSGGSNNAIATPSSHQSTFSGGSNYDAFLVKFNNNGVREWGTYYGGTGAEEDGGCAADLFGNVFLGGVSTSNTSTIIASPGAYQTNYMGNSDAFLAKFYTCFAPASPTNNTLPANTIVCAGNSATLTALAANSINWYNSLTSTLSLGTNTIFITSNLAPGNYTFYASTTSTCSESARTPFFVAALSPSINAVSGAICLGESFTISPSGANSYTFSNGPVITPTITTSYSVTGTDANGCISYTPLVVTISVNPTPTITSNNSSICIGDSFTITPNGASTYTYSSGNPVVSPGITTSYSVTGTTNFGCVSQTPAIVTVYVDPLPIISASNGTICSGQAFTINPSGANTYTYLNSGPVVSPTISASYSVTGTSTAGCISPTPAIVSVSVNPTPTINVNSGAICTGDSFTINPTGASTYTYSSGTNIVSPTSSGSYSVTGTDINGCVTLIQAISNVTVNALPSVNATTNSSIICTGQSATVTASGANTYSWNTTSTNTTIIISPTVNTTYTVTGTDANNCQNFSVITQSISLCTGVVTSGRVDAQKIKIYPNPSKDIFNIGCDCANENCMIEIYNTLGQLILNKKILSKNTEIDLSAYTAGLYYLKVKTQNKEEIIKLIKE